MTNQDVWMKDRLKRIASLQKQLPETEILVWFVNDAHGVEFWHGDFITIRQNLTNAQPLYGTKASFAQEPVAWMTRAHGILVTQDRSFYRDDLKWEPLYLARG